MALYGAGGEIDRANEIAKVRRNTATSLKGALDRLKRTISEAESNLKEVEDKIKALGTPTSAAAPTDLLDNDINGDPDSDLPF